MRSELGPDTGHLSGGGHRLPGRMSFVPAPHPPEVRQRAVDLARSKVEPVAEIAKDLAISESCLRNEPCRPGHVLAIMRA